MDKVTLLAQKRWVCMLFLIIRICLCFFYNLVWKMQSFLCGGTERGIAISPTVPAPFSVPCILQELVSLVSTH